jgi:rhomboid protease GluP
LFGRQRSGSVVCVSCGRLVGVHDEVCLNCGRRNPALWGWSPALRRLGADLGFTKLLVGGCIALYAVSLLLSPGAFSARGLMNLLAPRGEVLFLLGAAGSVPVFELGHWWTVLSAAWLHGSLLHIFFNMMWLRQLAPGVAQLYGAGRMILVWTAGSAAGFLASSASGAFLGGLPFFGPRAPLTIGASAPIFGLLGALLVYGRRSGHSGLSRQVWGWTIAGLLFGFVMPGIDNWAHLGGLAGGGAAARALDPLRPERIDHVVWAIVSVLAAFAAVAASVVTGLGML